MKTGNAVKFGALGKNNVERKHAKLTRDKSNDEIYESVIINRKFNNFE